MSADSGLRTYADAMHEAALAEVAHEKQAAHAAPVLSYHDLCQPTALIQHPSAFHDFWMGSLQNYRRAEPHEGYLILERLCASRAADATCVYTSNVDGLFRRFQTLRARLHEIHGCV